MFFNTSNVGGKLSTIIEKMMNGWIKWWVVLMEHECRRFSGLKRIWEKPIWKK